MLLAIDVSVTSHEPDAPFTFPDCYNNNNNNIFKKITFLHTNLGTQEHEIFQAIKNIFS